MKVRGADFVLYFVDDLQRSMAFYRDFLELELEFFHEQWQWAEFNAGNITLTLCGEGKYAERSSGGILALAVDDLHAAQEEAKAKGIPIRREVFELSTCWHLEISDPDGYTIILHRRKDGTCGQNQPHEAGPAEGQH